MSPRAGAETENGALTGRRGHCADVGEVRGQGERQAIREATHRPESETGRCSCPLPHLHHSSSLSPPPSSAVWPLARNGHVLPIGAGSPCSPVPLRFRLGAAQGLRCLGAQRGIILRLTCKAAISNRACHGFGALALVPFVLPPSLLLLRLVFCSTRACTTLGCAADRPRGRDNICLLLGAEFRDIVSSLLPTPPSLRTATPQAEGGCIADLGTLSFSLILPPPLVCVFKAYVCVAAPFFPLALPPAWCPASLTLNLCRRCREAVGLDLASPQQG